MIDLDAAADTMANLLTQVADEQLDRPTPCPDYRLGDLVEHVGGLTLAFTAAARKDIPEWGTRAPSPDASRLPADWRVRIPADLDRLVDAWRDPAAWTGMTQAGGVDLPGEVAGLVALDELVVHGWDVAQASGQTYVGDEASVAGARAFAETFPATGDRGPFGPVVPVPADATPLEQLLGLTGRDPGWQVD